MNEWHEKAKLDLVNQGNEITQKMHTMAQEHAAFAIMLHKIEGALELIETFLKEN